jgi:arylsulfatase
MNWTVVKIGDVFDPATAPQIAGQGFQIRCTIEGSKPSGIILAHGGSSIGYALYMTANDELVFAVRHRSDLVKRVTVPLKGKGKFSIVADLAKNGTLSLSLDEAKAVTVASPGTLKMQPQENLCIGHDDKNPLDEKAPGGMFKGAIPSIELLVR